MPGRVYDTYAAALQHHLVDLPEDAERLGVVRRPTPWFYGVVDRNESALGPPADMLAAVKARTEDLIAAGLDDAAAHNRAMDEVDYDEAYLEYLETDPAAKEAVEDIRGQLVSGEDVVLVCFENTSEKRCHRTLLRERLERGSG